MKPIVILRAGDAAPPVAERRGQFHEWIQRVIGDGWPRAWRVVDVRTDEPLPAPTDAAAFIMTGSSSSVTERAPWMLRAEEHLRGSFGPGGGVSVGAIIISRGTVVGAAPRRDQFENKLIQRLVFSEALANPMVEILQALPVEHLLLGPQQVRPFQGPKIGKLLPLQQGVDQPGPLVPP